MVVLDELVERIVLQWNARVRIVIQDFVSGQARHFELFHSQVDLSMHFLDLFSAEVLEGSVDAGCWAFDEVLLIIADHLFGVLFGLHVLVVLV